MASSTSHLIGQRVGEYEVIRRIGLGGMGAVYEGKHPLIGKRVAIKVLLPEFSSDEAQMKRFLAEARSVNEIRHRGIVDIFAFGQLPDGSHYFVMEFLEGHSFEQLLKLRTSLPAVEVLALMDEVLDAVGAAHQAGIVHRDLKPSNLFLVDIGRGRPFVKLLDFGVAKLTKEEGGVKKEATAIVGSPIYMAPEQVNGQRAGPQADLYALGVVFFELITGRPPFKADSWVEMMSRHLEARPPRLSEVKPGIPPELDRLVDQLLAKRPQDRPADADAVRVEVARIRAQLDRPIRRGMSPQQRAALEEDVGPTMVRVVKRGAGTIPDISPVQSRQVGKVDPERTQIAAPVAKAAPESSLPWGDGPVPTLKNFDSDPNLEGRTVIENEPSVERPRPTAEQKQPIQPVPTLEHPIPTRVRGPSEKATAMLPMEIPVPTAPLAISEERVAAIAKRNNSQSAPTLSAVDEKDLPSWPPPGEPSLSGGARVTDQQPAVTLDTSDAVESGGLGKLWLALSLGALGIVLVAIIVLVATRAS